MFEVKEKFLLFFFWDRDPFSKKKFFHKNIENEFSAPYFRAEKRKNFLLSHVKVKQSWFSRYLRNEKRKESFEEMLTRYIEDVDVDVYIKFSNFLHFPY